jgi:hypothetical protein
VKEFQKKGPSDEQEVFNRHHSKMRNVIERTFDAIKSKVEDVERHASLSGNQANTNNYSSMCTAQLRA